MTAFRPNARIRGFKHSVIGAEWALNVALLTAYVVEMNRWIVLVILLVLSQSALILLLLRLGPRLLTFRQNTSSILLNRESNWLLYSLTITAAAWLLLNHREAWLQAVLLAVALGLLFWSSQNLQGMTERSAPYVAHIPGVPEQRPERPATSVHRVGSIGLMTLPVALTILTIPISPWITVGLVIGSLVVSTILSLPIRRYARQVEAIFRALEEYAPVFAIPHDGGALFHFDMWLPYFEEAGLPYVQITTRLKSFKEREAESGAPLIGPADESNTDDLLNCFPPSIKAAFYPRNGPLNIKFIAGRPNVTHIFLHHGDGDKPASSTKRSAQYDVLVVAGEAAIDRYARRGVEIPREKFVICGRPQVSNILEAQGAIASVDRPSVLYAPTWRGRSERANFSSLPVGTKIVGALLERGCRVIFRPHPLGQNYPPHAEAITEITAMLEEDSTASDVPHMWGPEAESLRTLADVSNESDALVSDVSGVITDYMQSGKPFIMVATSVSTAEFRETFLSSQSAYVVESADLSTLDPALDDLLGEDSLRAKRLERRRYYLGGFSGDEAAQEFIRYLHKLAGQ